MYNKSTINDLTRLQLYSICSKAHTCEKCKLRVNTRINSGFHSWGTKIQRLNVKQGLYTAINSINGYILPRIQKQIEKKDTQTYTQRHSDTNAHKQTHRQHKHIRTGICIYSTRREKYTHKRLRWARRGTRNHNTISRHVITKALIISHDARTGSS